MPIEWEVKLLSLEEYASRTTFGQSKDMDASWAFELDGNIVTLALLIGFLSLLYWYSRSAFSQLERMGIKHPKPLPFIGNVMVFHTGFLEGAKHILQTCGPISG
ncbi:thromboxane-A synthase isoform X1 [Pelobates cultripes]|uniref:Thromboxane-A synthase isoform X1 n=1 Tax=Pelobates cultripes TaxID=61616 RepID=A0AAD1RQY6_PELCU|nr:thromboxane-A synthase isoform X1 [Pelobates cultripes]